MLISMPTGTSTILGVFQVIPSSQLVWRELRAGVEPRSTSDIAQVRKIEDQRLRCMPDSRYFSLGQSDFSLEQDNQDKGDMDPANPHEISNSFFIDPNVKTRTNTAAPRQTSKSL
jgi:hypothetical protein